MTGHQCTEIEHYLFRDANSFSGAKLEESCELRGTDNFRGQKYEHIFQRKMEATVTTLYRLPRGMLRFRPITRKQK